MQAEALEEVSALMEESRLLRDSAHLLCAERMHNQTVELPADAQALPPEAPSPGLPSSPASRGAP